MAVFSVNFCPVLAKSNFILGKTPLRRIMNPAASQTQSMQTRDGVRLDADVYYPEGPGPFPVLLMRQPYGRAIASTVVYAHPQWYASQGFIVVIQDVRGRGSSEGQFGLFGAEIQDGYDAVIWAASLPQSNGRVGMYGFSYQGMTQLYAAVEQPEPLRAIAPAMCAYDLYRDWAYEGDTFCLQSNLAWALQLAAEGARLAGDQPAFGRLTRAAKALPLQDDVPAHPDLLQNCPYDVFYQDWLTKPQEDEYWRSRSPQTYINQLAPLPMLHIGGWFDFLMRGTLHLYEAMIKQGEAPQRLIVGPWAHLPWGRHLGAMDYGAGAISPVDRAQVQWFNHWLKGSGHLDAAPVQLFEMGSNQWLNFDRWPQPDSQVSLYLHPTGCVTMNEGLLLGEKPQGGKADVWIHDPWRPVPALGGHAVAPSGRLDRAVIDERSDVLTYTTSPLTQPWHILGEIQVTLQCIAPQPSFDLCAVLSEVYPDGRVYNFAQGICHCLASKATPTHHITLQAVALQVSVGHRLRLSISATCFPAYPTNSGTGTALDRTPSIDHRIITLTLMSEPGDPSEVNIPLIFT
jgi:uncharacterized protein